MNTPTAGAGRPGDTAPWSGGRRPSGLPQGQREDPATGKGRLHVVFGTGQVGTALAAHLADRGIPVRTVSKHRPAALPGGADWRAADVTDPEAAADAAKGATVISPRQGRPTRGLPCLAAAGDGSSRPRAR